MYYRTSACHNSHCMGKFRACAHRNYELAYSHEIWHRCLSWGVDVQDTFFDSGKKCVAMVTAYYGQKMGENLAS